MNLLKEFSSVLKFITASPFMDSLEIRLSLTTEQDQSSTILHLFSFLQEPIQSSYQLQSIIPLLFSNLHTFIFDIKIGYFNFHYQTIKLNKSSICKNP